jgi:hypothetical protein
LAIPPNPQAGNRLGANLIFLLLPPCLRLSTPTCSVGEKWMNGREEGISGDG